MVVRVAAHRVQGRLIDEVGEVRAAHARRAARDDGHEVDRRVERFTLGVDLEDGQALFEVGQGNHDLTVESARAQERRVEDVGTVGGGDDDDALGRFEAVHLAQASG